MAIATALMPPLAVVGFGLATFNGTVFWGALLLFLTMSLQICSTTAFGEEDVMVALVGVWLFCSCWLPSRAHEPLQASLGQ